MISYLPTDTEGVSLFYRFDQALNPKANIIIHHGFAEHLGRYDYVARKLWEAGYNVMRFDARGHGLTTGPRGHVDNYENFITDLDFIVNVTEFLAPNLPIYTLGHSMGGMVTLMYGLTYPENLAGQIFSGAASGTLPYLNEVTKKLLISSAAVIPTKLFKNIVSDDICTDPQVVQDYLDDPLVLKKASFKFFNEFLLESPKYIEARIDSYDLDTLILHGKDDKVVPVALSERLYHRIPSKNKELITYDGLYHEILNEPIKDEIINEILDWLSSRHITRINK